MLKRYSGSGRIMRFILFLLYTFSFSVFAQDTHIGWEPDPDDNVCVKDINGDGKTDDAGEALLCGEGSTYDPFKAYQFGEASGYSLIPAPTCAIDQVSCIKEDIAYCPYDDSVCTSSTCDKLTSCNSVSWTETEVQTIVGTVTNRPVLSPSPSCSFDITNSYFYCPFGGSTGYAKPNQCLIEEPLCGSVVWEGGEPVEAWFCSYTDQWYPTEEAATSACTYTENVTIEYNGFDCPLTPYNDKYSTAGSCSSSCKETAACEKEKNFVCPIGDEFACVNLDSTNSSDNFVCSDSPCGRYEDTSENTPVDRDMLVDDGDYDAEGNCLGAVMIFTGRAMDCRVPGIASAYQNCCNKADDDIYNDNMGGLTETAITLEVISLTYGAATAAYATYSAGGTAAEAGASATEFLSGAVDPTTLAIAAAVLIIMEYLESACPPEDIETAMLDASGYCVTIGEKCTTKWFGSCVQEVEVKCCFNSMMARIINEQGRPQLGMTFGTPNAPQCEGFSAEQFQALDFSKIDLSEYYDEIRLNSQTEVEGIISEGITDATGG